MKPTQITSMITAAILLVSVSMITMTTAIATETYDLVILNGRVMDPETKVEG